MTNLMGPIHLLVTLRGGCYRLKGANCHIGIIYLKMGAFS